MSTSKVGILGAEPEAGKAVEPGNTHAVVNRLITSGYFTIYLVFVYIWKYGWANSGGRKENKV